LSFWSATSLRARVLEAIESAYSEFPSGSSAPVQGCPSHFIEIVLRDEDGRPVPDEPVEVRAANAVLAATRLDADGFVRVENLSCSTVCEVCFPRLDKRIWMAARS
jgi:hypothetical protein